MILSKQNLEIFSVPQADKGIPVLNNVHVTADGATLAANSKSFICVSPVQEDVKKALPLQETGEPGEFSLSIGLCKELCNAMPADNQFNGLTEHTAVQGVETGELEFTMTDGKRKRSILGKKFERAYIEYKGFLKKIFGRREPKARIVLNRKRVLTLLSTLEKLCSDKTGQSLLYMEVLQDDSIIMRSVNHRNGQHASAFMSSYAQSEEQWIENNVWENQYADIAKIKKLT